MNITITAQMCLLVIIGVAHRTIVAANYTYIRTEFACTATLTLLQISTGFTTASAVLANGIAVTVAAGHTVITPAACAVAAYFITTGANLFTVAAFTAVKTPAVSTVNTNLSAISANCDTVGAKITLAALAHIFTRKAGFTATGTDRISVTVAAGFAV